MSNDADEAQEIAIAHGVLQGPGDSAAGDLLAEIDHHKHDALRLDGPGSHVHRRLPLRDRPAHSNPQSYTATGCCPTSSPCSTAGRNNN
jgi:hypothetical protein